MNENFGNTAKDGGFSSLDFRSKHNIKDGKDTENADN
jgi:hypothetical protein